MCHFGIVQLLLVLMVSSVACAESYEKITGDSTSTLYLVKGSIDRSGRNGANFPSLRVLLDFEQGHSTPYGVARSATIQMFLDCPLRRQIITHTIYHGGRMGRSQTIVTDTEVSNNDIRGGFLLVYKRVCP